MSCSGRESYVLLWGIVPQILVVISSAETIHSYRYIGPFKEAVRSFREGVAKRDSVAERLAASKRSVKGVRGFRVSGS